VAGRYAECGTPKLRQHSPARAGVDPGKPDAGKLARPVWGRADRKGLGNQHLAGGGVYWKPIFNLLEEAFELLVVNAQHIKAVPGRKTDVRLRHEVVSVAVALA
jgi:hypothetical protein